MNFGSENNSQRKVSYLNMLISGKTDELKILLINSIFIFYFVKSLMKGRINKGASVCPRKMLPAVFKLSTAVVPIATFNIHPI